MGDLFERQSGGNLVQSNEGSFYIATEVFKTILALVLRKTQRRRACKIGFTEWKRYAESVPAPALSKTSIGNGKQIKGLTGSLDEICHSLFGLIDRPFGTIRCKNERCASVFCYFQQFPKSLDPAIARRPSHAQNTKPPEKA